MIKKIQVFNASWFAMSRIVVNKVAEYSFCFFILEYTANILTKLNMEVCHYDNTEAS